MLHTCLADTVFPCRHCSSHKDERERKKLWRQRKKKKTKTVKIFISWGTLSHDSFPFHSNRHTPHRGPGPFAAAWRRPSRPCRRAETRPSFPAVEAFFLCFFAREERSRGGEGERGEVRNKKRTLPPFSLEGKHRKISSSALPQRRDRRSGRASSPGARRGRGRADYYFLVGGERFGKRSKVEKNGKEKTSRNQSPLFTTKATFSSSFLTVETSNGLLAAGRKAAERRSESRECEEETDVEQEEEQAVAADDDSEFGIDSDSAAVAPVTARRPRGAPGAQRGDRDAGKLLVTRDIFDDAERFASFRNGISRKPERNRGRRR